MQPIFLIAGPPAVGKSTTSRAVAARFPQSIHIPVDDLREMVVSGKLLPAAEWSDALAQQVRLARAAAVHMAQAYQQAGFAVVIDDFIDPNHRADYAALSCLPHIHRIVLYPEQAEAHRRNFQRAGDSPARGYIDQGIEIVYQQMREQMPRLAQDGWRVLDTTRLSVEETAAAILA